MPSRSKRDRRRSSRSVRSIVTAREKSAARTSSLLPLVHHLHEIAEQVERVVGAGGGFGVVLDGDGGLAAVAETFERLVVEIDVHVLDLVLRQRVGIDRKAVILRGDLDAAGAEVLDRMIAAAMAELQLVRPAAEREA